MITIETVDVQPFAEAKEPGPQKTTPKHFNLLGVSAHAAYRRK